MYEFGLMISFVTFVFFVDHYLPLSVLRVFVVR
jgi:hypothetical protein